MSTGEILLFGCIGGLLPDVLTLIQSGNREHFPKQFSIPWWWITLVLTVAVGGFVAYMVHPASKVTAVTTGFAAPEVLRRLVGATGSRMPGQDAAPAPAVAMAPTSAREYLA
jgi:hypothetical protein